MAQDAHEPKPLKLVADHAGPSATEQLAAERKLCGALRALNERLNDGKERSLRPGMLVQWKSGLKNRTRPLYGAPVVAVKVLDKSIEDESFNSGSPYYREPLGLVIGFLDDDGEFLTIHVDPRRFEPYKGETPQESNP